MADKETKELPNLKAKEGFMLNGKRIGKGRVVAKSEFTNKGDWMNLCADGFNRCVETDDAVTPEKDRRTDVSDESAEKTAKKAALPGA